MLVPSADELLQLDQAKEAADEVTSTVLSHSTTTRIHITQLKLKFQSFEEMSPIETSYQMKKYNYQTEITVHGLTNHPTGTRTHYPDSEPTRLCSFSIMLRA
jgi:hypothetical protein